jgi:hypothetical protein
MLCAQHDLENVTNKHAIAGHLLAGILLHLSLDPHSVQVLASLQQLQLLRGNPCAPISLGAGLDTSGLMTNLLSSSPMGSSSMAAPGLPATWSVDFPSIAQVTTVSYAPVCRLFSTVSHGNCGNAIQLNRRPSVGVASNMHCIVWYILGLN